MSDTPRTRKLPDCMMPDGDDPCIGYKQLEREAAYLRAHTNEQDWQEMRAELAHKSDRIVRLENKVAALKLALDTVVDAAKASREATIDECDRALSEAANGCRPIEQYYLHGLWKARHILAFLKQKGSP